MIENQGNPDEIETLDFEKLIKNLDPDLWKAVCLITKPVSLKAQSNLYGSHIRKIRRLFCAYTLLFTTNSHCSFSIHSLLADIVETCDGSSRLLKILNRFGICSSADTHNRYVIERVNIGKLE